MQYDVRLSLDTLYFGLQISAEDFHWAFPEIKNYLFFTLQENTSRSRSKYYSMEAVNEDNGFYCFFSPHKNLANDYATIQLTGKFFREYHNLKSLEQIFEFFNGFIRYQRVDVALDILYNELPPNCGIDGKSNNLGFPFPRYSDNWKNVKLPFNTYGRFNEGFQYINMVSCGKGDLVLRVYDKDLDLMEKYGLTYDKYYGFEKPFKKTFRIEYQMRGKALKEFCDNSLDLDINIFDFDRLCGAVMSCVFYKYSFEYIDDVHNPLYIQTSCKRASTLQGRKTFHLNKARFHYFQYDDCLQEEREYNLQNEFKIQEYNQVKKFVENESAKDLGVIASVFDFDYEKAIQDDIKRRMGEIPF